CLAPRARSTSHRCRPAARSWPQGRARGGHVRLGGLVERHEGPRHDCDPIADRAWYWLRGEKLPPPPPAVPPAPPERPAPPQGVDLQPHVRHPVRGVIENVPADPRRGTIEYRWGVVSRRRPAHAEPAASNPGIALCRSCRRKQREQREPERDLGSQTACFHAE